MDTAYDFDSFDSSDIFDPLAPYRSENPEDEDQSVEPATTPYESTEYQDLQQFYHDQDPAYSARPIGHSSASPTKSSRKLPFSTTGATLNLTANSANALSAASP